MILLWGRAFDIIREERDRLNNVKSHLDYPAPHLESYRKTRLAVS